MTNTFSFKHTMNIPADDVFMRDMRVIQRPLINDPENHIDHFNERVHKVSGAPIEIDHLVLHCFHEPNIEDVWESCVLSAHYVVHNDGTIVQCVDESKRAYHAGCKFKRDGQELPHGEKDFAMWNGVGGFEDNMNAHSIGIEVENADFGKTQAYSVAAMASLLHLCQSIMERHNIAPHNVIGHSDVSPNRKADPGVMFPWEWLARHGVGVWPTANKSKNPENDPVKLLKSIGYKTNNPSAALRAFERHFMPQFIQDEEKDPKKALASMQNYAENMKQSLGKSVQPAPEVMNQLKCVADAYRLSRFKSQLRFR